jgi:hypothetical protein
MNDDAFADDATYNVALKQQLEDLLRDAAVGGYFQQQPKLIACILDGLLHNHRKFPDQTADEMFEGIISAAWSAVMSYAEMLERRVEDADDDGEEDCSGCCDEVLKMPEPEKDYQKEVRMLSDEEVAKLSPYELEWQHLIEGTVSKVQYQVAKAFLKR